jgi:hypothetical protein
MAAAPAARVKNQEYRLMCLENDGFFSTGLSQKERSKKKNERNPSDERQREIGEARFVWRCPQSPPPHSACRVLLFPAAQLANTIFLSNKPNRRLFYKKKIDRNLHKFDLWPLAAMKRFFWVVYREMIDSCEMVAHLIECSCFIYEKLSDDIR